MTQDEYNGQIGRLRNFYGKDKYPQERLTIFWKHLKSYPCYALTTAVTNLIANNQFAPLLDKILIATKDADRTQMAVSGDRGEVELNKIEWCELCDKSGTVQAYLRSTRALYVFKCPCKAGEHFGMDWPVWDSECSGNFEVYIHEETRGDFLSLEETTKQRQKLLSLPFARKIIMKEEAEDVQRRSR